MKIIIVIVITILTSSIAYSSCQTEFISGICNVTSDGSTPSCEQIDVTAAISSVASGDTVLIPAGSCTWSGSVTITGKNIILQGSGQGNTNITFGDITAVSYGDVNSSIITGITFLGNGTSESSIGVRPKGGGWRVHHCTFDFRGASKKGLGVFATVRNLYTTDLGGVVDNCTFWDATNGSEGAAVSGTGYEAFVGMSRPIDLGGSTSIYFEDCVFHTARFGNIMDTNYGGSYVIRFCTVDRTGSETGYNFEIHSLQHYQSRGSRKWEIYGNTINANDAFMPFLLRASTGVVFGNTVTGTWTLKSIRLDNVRSTTDIGGDAGLCDGDSDWDGNEDGYGWPCRDQIGTAGDISAWTESAPYPAIVKQPAYFWNNSPSDVKGSVAATSADWIKSDRDFYDMNADDASCTAGGSCTKGVGSGTTLPSICSTGVGFWKTDEGDWNNARVGMIGYGFGNGVLYKCTDTNTWTAYYQPYTYPHPLRGLGGKPITIGSGSQVNVGSGSAVTITE